MTSGENNAAVSKATDRALWITPRTGLVCALLVGLAVWGGLEASMPVFRLPAELQDLRGNVAEEEMLKQRQAILVVAAKNATLSLAALSFGLGMVLTGAEQLMRRNRRQAIFGGLLAGVLAGAIAVGAGTLGAVLLQRLDLPDHRLVKTMIVQCAMLSVMGLGIGLAMGLALFRASLAKTCVAGCLLGGLLAAILFPIVIGVALPRVNTELMMPDSSVGRLLWVVLPAGLIGLIVTGLGKAKSSKAITNPQGDC